MSESGLRQTIVRELKSLDAISVENPVYPGTPDVNFIGGWMELKWLRKWPERKETIVSIPHFTPQQRVWLYRRWRRGGFSCLLLKVGREVLVFDGDVASESVGRVTKGELYDMAACAWHKGFRTGELNKWVSSASSRRESKLLSGVDGHDSVSGTQPIS